MVARTLLLVAMSTTDRNTSSGRMKWLSGLAALAGAILLVSPFVLEATTAAVWNNGIVGAAILIIAGYNGYRLQNDRPMIVGTMWLVALLGLWTIAAPFAFEIGAEALLWTNVVLGIVVALLAAGVANAGRKMRTEAPVLAN